MSARRSEWMRTRRAAVLLFALGALVVGIGAPVVVQVAQAPAAEAVCPPGSSGGGLIASWGQEWNVTGTCDWDNTYHGWLQDRVTDGSCVWSYIYDGGYWVAQAYACTTGAWVDYWKWDVDGDYFSLMNLCRNQGCMFYGNDAWNYGY